MNNDKLIRLTGSDFILMEPFPEDKPRIDNGFRLCGYPIRRKDRTYDSCIRLVTPTVGCSLHTGKKMKYKCEHGTCTNLTHVVRDGTPTCYKHGNADRIRLCRLRKLSVPSLA